MAKKHYISYSIKNLINNLCNNLKKNNNEKDIFKNIIIITQTEGLKNYLQYRITDQLEIFAGYKFFKINDFLFDFLFERINYDFEIKKKYNKNVLSLIIFENIENFFENDDFKNLKDYVNYNNNNIKDFNYYERLYQISLNIADIFDQYQIYREDYIKNWEDDKLNINDNFFSKNEIWQKKLWNELKKIVSEQSRVDLKKIFCEKIKNNNNAEEILRDIKKIIFFGITTLSPYHNEIYDLISEYVDIEFYNISLFINSDISNNYILFNKWKKSLYEYFTLLKVENYFVKKEELNFDNTILGALKHSIFFSNYNEKISVDKENNNLPSFRVLATHSKYREIEILYDNILYLLQNDNDLKPSDIMVCATDIMEYMPYIEAVFKDNTLYSGYIIDETEKKYIEIFLNSLEILDSRFEVNKIFNLLAIPEIYTNFGFDYEEIILIKEWLIDTDVKYALDIEHKKELNLAENIYMETWEYFFERMIAGFYTNTDEIIEYQNYEIKPYKELYGTKLITFNKFINFFETIRSTYDKIKNEKNYKKIIEILTEYYEKLVAGSKVNKRYMSFVSLYLNIIDTEFTKADFKKEIDYRLIIYILKQRIRLREDVDRYLINRITFSDLIPMRLVPFKAIFVLGLNKDSFPRKNYKDNFNLINYEERLCDRNLEMTDLFLMLELIISSQKYLYISYQGFNSQKGTEISPPQPVSYIIEYLNEKYNIKEDTLLIKHKLNPFNKEYYKGVFNNGLFTYNDVYKEIFNYNKDIKSLIFNDEVFEILKNKFSNLNKINLNDFIFSFKKPERFFLTSILNIKLPEDKILMDSEEFSIEGITKYEIIERIINYYMIPENFNAKLEDYQIGLYNEFKLSSKIPFGEIGRISLSSLIEKEKLYDTVEIIKDIVRNHNLIEEYFIDDRFNDYKLRLYKHNNDILHLFVYMDDLNYSNLFEIIIKAQIFFDHYQDGKIKIIHKGKDCINIDRNKLEDILTENLRLEKLISIYRYNDEKIKPVPLLYDIAEKIKTPDINEIKEKIFERLLNLDDSYSDIKDRYIKLFVRIILQNDENYEYLLNIFKNNYEELILKLNDFKVKLINEKSE